MAKGTECDRGVADRGLICESHLQDRNVIDDGCGNGGDEKQDRSGEYKESADMVEDTRACHLDCLVVFEFVICCVLTKRLYFGNRT